MIRLFIALGAVIFMSGCTGNIGTRHFVEDYDVIRFEQTTVFGDVRAAKPTGSSFCPEVAAWVGGEHDIAGDPYKIVEVGASCSFGWW